MKAAALYILTTTTSPLKCLQMFPMVPRNLSIKNDFNLFLGIEQDPFEYKADQC